MPSPEEPAAQYGGDSDEPEAEPPPHLALRVPLCDEIGAHTRQNGDPECHRYECPVPEECPHEGQPVGHSDDGWNEDEAEHEGGHRREGDDHSVRLRTTTASTARTTAITPM